MYAEELKLFFCMHGRDLKTFRFNVLFLGLFMILKFKQTANGKLN